MNEKLCRKILIVLFLYTSHSWAAGDFIMDNVTDLSTARLSLVCSQIADGKTKAENFNQGLCIGIILGVEDNAHYDKKFVSPKMLILKSVLK